MANPLLQLVQGAGSMLGLRLGYDQPRYRVEEVLAGGVEIRSYAPRLAARVRITDGHGWDGRRQGFRALAGYIFGRNADRAKLAMTIPVAVSGDAAFADAAGAGNEPFEMAFFLPHHLDQDTAPPPDDHRVEVVEFPAETAAARRFRGSIRDGRLTRETDALTAALATSQWRPTRAPGVLFYDPPTCPPPLKRTEVWVPVRPLT